MLDFIAKARKDAVRALQLDEQLPEAHTALAVIAQNYDWEWKTAENEYRRAIALDSNYATAHHWYAEFLSFQGRFDESLAEFARARALDPLSLVIANDRAVALYFARQYDRAIDQFRAVLDLEPRFGRAHMIAYAYLEEGRFEEALAVAESWNRQEDSVWSWAVLAYIYGRGGQQAEARQALARLEKLKNADPFVLVVPYLSVGEKEKALAYLQKAYEGHAVSLPALKVDPAYDPIRSDPRFQEVLRKIHLAG